MLRGTFGSPNDSPYIDGHVVLPRLNLQGSVRFLVDTGADNGVIMPADAARLGVNFGRLLTRSERIGLGGRVTLYEERALVTFADSHRTFTYNVNIDITRPHRDIEKVTSLLGRDILKRWRMIYDPARKILSFKVNSADLTKST